MKNKIRDLCFFIIFQLCKLDAFALQNKNKI